MEQITESPIADNDSNEKASAMTKDTVTSSIPGNTADLAAIRELLIKQNRIGKRKAIILLVIAVAIVAFCIYGIFSAATLMPKLNASIDSINTAVDSINGVIETVNIDQLNNVIDDTSSIAKEGVSIVEQAKTLLEGLNGIDFDSLNSSIKGLNATLESVSVVDFDTLNKAIGDLQTAIEPLANFVKKFK